MKNSWLGWVGSGVSVIFTAIQTNEVFAWISFGVTLLSVLVTLAFNIWKWVKMAKEDGKITKEEIKEGAEIIVDGLDNIKEVIEKHPNDKEGENK